MSLVKHVGKYGEKPCVIVFRELPNDAENCLIVQTESLEKVMHDDLMAVVVSAEAQEANDLSQVLHRRQFSDSSNMLSTLHYSKRLQKVPVDKVWLVPSPGQAVPLEAVNAEVRKINGGFVPPKTDESHLSEPAPRAPTPVSVETESTAQNLILQAKLLEEDAQALMRDAQAKLHEAYRLDPSLEPVNQVAAESKPTTTKEKKTTKRTSKKASL